MTDAYDAEVVVFGGTPGGIATAVRTAREDMDTLLVTLKPHLGGALPSLGGLDSFYDGERSPILQEFLASLEEYYRDEYGENSDDYAKAVGESIPHLASYEPHVAENILEQLVAEENNLNVEREFQIEGVERGPELIQRVTFDSFTSEKSIVIEADTFVDATYEGDLLANAGVSYTVGRESRQEFEEQHAGRIFTSGGTEGGSEGVGEYKRDAAAGDLNLDIWGEVSKEILTGSTGEGDNAVQAYCHRICMSSDPDNRRAIEKPDNYDRNRYVGIVQDPEDTFEEEHQLHSRFLNHAPEDLSFPYSGPWLPNDKVGMNAGNLVGGADEYPDANWQTRMEIIEAHENHALGLMYFMQNDPEVPDEVQSEAQEWGLACDEFTDNDNIPRHMYIREARRLVGKYVLTEDDMRVAPGIDRPPIFEDSIAIAGDWYMDSHNCTTDRVRGSMGDGKILLTEVTRPCHIPYRMLLPDQLRNLIVPVPVSASHVAWGGIRLEPTWMHIGEAAGYAVVLAAEKGVPPDALNVDQLQRKLTESGVMLSFFNEFDMNSDEDWVPAVQYLGTKGFFDSFDARPEDRLTSSCASEWAQTAVAILTDDVDGTERAQAVRNDGEDNPAVTADEFIDMLCWELQHAGMEERAIELQERKGEPRTELLRGEACQLVYNLLRM